jgi:hypothetical protein
MIVLFWLNISNSTEDLKNQANFKMGHACSVGTTLEKRVELLPQQHPKIWTRLPLQLLEIEWHANSCTMGHDNRYSINGGRPAVWLRTVHFFHVPPGEVVASAN